MLGRFSKQPEKTPEVNRAPQRAPEVPTAAAAQAAAEAEAKRAAAQRPAQSAAPSRMVIPEGVTIEGNITGTAETEIHGHVKGDISVTGRLFLGQSAVIAGNVRAQACRIDGIVEGAVECTDEVQLGATGRLSADVNAGKQVDIAGRVNGNVTTPGILRLAPGSCIEGDVRTSRLIMEEGATVNGRCSMRSPGKEIPKPDAKQ